MRFWSFLPDANFDGIISISDCWLWFKWLFYYPGDLLIFVSFEYAPVLTRFLEVRAPAYGGSVSGVVSLVLWFLAFRLLGALLARIIKRDDYVPPGTVVRAAASDLHPRRFRVLQVLLGCVLLAWVGIGS